MVSLIERDLGIREDENGDHSVRGVYRHEETSSLGSCFGRSTKNGIDSFLTDENDNFLCSPPCAWSIVGPGSGITTFTLFNINIPSSTKIVYAVAFALIGGFSIRDLLTYPVTVWIPPPPECSMLYDNIESGINGFTITGFWHQEEDGVTTCPNSHSPTHSWWYGISATGCTYDNGLTNNGSLYSPSISPCSSTANTATLSFWSWEETECITTMCSYDTRRLYISSDGVTWTQLWESDNYNISTWFQVYIPLFNVNPGNPIQLQWRFDTIDDLSNNYIGWYIDDILITQP